MRSFRCARSGWGWCALALAFLCWCVVALPAGRSLRADGELAITSVQHSGDSWAIGVRLSAGGPFDASNATVLIDGAPVQATIEPTGGASAPAVVIALETSASMAGERLAHAQRAAQAVIDGLQADARVAVVTFDSSVRTVAELSNDRSAASAAVAGAGASGSSALYGAVAHAARLLEREPSTHRQLVLLGYGWDFGRASQSSRSDSLQAVRAAAVRVFPVVVGADFDVNYLTELAADSGWRLWGAEHATSGALAAAANGARMPEYVLRIPAQGLSAGRHELSVRWARPGGEVAASSAFEVAAPVASPATPGARPQPTAAPSEPAGLPLVPIAAAVGALALAAAVWFGVRPLLSALAQRRQARRSRRVAAIAAATAQQGHVLERLGRVLGDGADGAEGHLDARADSTKLVTVDAREERKSA